MVPPLAMQVGSRPTVVVVVWLAAVLSGLQAKPTSLHREYSNPETTMVNAVG